MTYRNLIRFEEEDPVIETDDRDISLVRSLSKDEQFSLILSDLVTDEDSFLAFLDILVSLEKNKLYGCVKKGLNDPDKYVRMISHYAEFSPKERKKMLHDPAKVRKENLLHAVQSMLWEKGYGVQRLGFSYPFVVPKDIVDQEVRVALKKHAALVKDAYQDKLGEMDNLINNIISCFPKDETRGLVSADHKLTFLKSLITSFKNCAMPTSLDPSAFRVPKEAGVCLPQTLSSSEWLAATVVRVIAHELGKSYAPAFVTKDVVSISRLKTSDYIVVSDDDDSAFSVQNSPSIYCNSFQELEDSHKTVWKWRAIAMEINKQVNLQVVKDGDHSPEHRQRLLEMFQLDYALQLKEQSHYDAPIRDGPLVQFTGALREDTGLKGLIMFAKKGYSKQADIKEKPDLVHIVSVNTSDLIKGEFVKYLLPDLCSVILIPTPLWSKMRGGSSTRTHYASRYGMKDPGPSSRPTNLLFFMTMIGLESTFSMFDAWAAGKSFSVEKFFADVVKRIAVNSECYPTIFPRLSYDHESIKRSFTFLSAVYGGDLQGMVISPATSKSGTATSKKLNEGAGFQGFYANVEQINLNYGDFDTDLGFTNILDAGDYDYDLQVDHSQIQLADEVDDHEVDF